MAYEILRFPYDRTIDADGHLLEPANLWEDYLEAEFKHRALRVKRDDDGLEYLEIDNKPSIRTSKGSLGLMGAMGEKGIRPSKDRLYMDHIPYGAGDAQQRVALLDQENLEQSILYPTIGLLWECELTDPQLTLAYQRAYNRWVADFCRASPRLHAVAQLTLLDPEGSAKELKRAVKDGCIGAFIAPFTHTRKPHGHPDHDVLFRTCVELAVPIAVHPTFEPGWATPVRFDGFTPGQAGFFYQVIARQGVQQALMSFFALGTLERHPQLRVGILESGSGWLGAFLDRADAVFDTYPQGATGLRMRPSDYFRRQVFVSGDPDETAAPFTIEHVGADNFMWATDYPHPDHTGSWVDALTRFAAVLKEPTRSKVLGENARRIYQLPAVA